MATSFKEYISNTDRRRELAKALDTDPVYLWQIATHWRGRRASVEMAKRIQEATNNEVMAAQVLGLDLVA